MFKISTILLMLLLVSGCSQDDDGDQESLEPYSHPTWILGNWELEATTTTSQYDSFVFSNDNIIISFLDGSVLNFEQDQVNYSFVLEDASNYSFQFMEENASIATSIDIILIAENKFVLNAGNFDTYLKTE
ncbi:MAG: hypothetical protein HKM28_06710 [Flavobacteriaceae bacterium]|nr:hypothetical protein [Flavobacteriaceae bacterium]